MPPHCNRQTDSNTKPRQSAFPMANAPASTKITVFTQPASLLLSSNSPCLTAHSSRYRVLQLHYLLALMVCTITGSCPFTKIYSATLYKWSLSPTIETADHRLWKDYQRKDFTSYSAYAHFPFQLGLAADRLNSTPLIAVAAHLDSLTSARAHIRE